MKRYVLIIIFFTLYSNISLAGTGKGELILTERGVSGFYKYITNPGGSTPGRAKPLRMVISHDGNYAHWFVCRHAACTSNGFTELIKICERKQTQPCSGFAVGRSIKWKNGLNPGGKQAAFKSNMSLYEVKEKLRVLGFYK